MGFEVKVFQGLGWRLYSFRVIGRGLSGPGFRVWLVKIPRVSKYPIIEDLGYW